MTLIGSNKSPSIPVAKWHFIFQNIPVKRAHVPPTAQKSVKQSMSVTKIEKPNKEPRTNTPKSILDKVLSTTVECYRLHHAMRFSIITL